MDKMVEKIIQDESKTIIKKFNIQEKDCDRVFNIMHKTVFYFRKDLDPLRKRVSFDPSLDEALTYLSHEKSFNIFENSDFRELLNKCFIIELIFNKDTPFYTLQELSDILRKFVKYLESNKISLISIGYPFKNFSSSFWLYNKLSHLYPLKFAHSIQIQSSSKKSRTIIDNITKKDLDDSLIYNYIWLKKDIKHYKPIDNISLCSYEFAPLIDGFSKKDEEIIESIRAKVFYVKIQILEIAYSFLTNKKDIRDFWSECFEILSSKFTKEELENLWKMDVKYEINKNFIDKTTLDNFSFLSEIFLSEVGHGGILNILGFINHIERELKLGVMHNLKLNFLSFFSNSMPLSYFQCISHPQIVKIDKIILDFKFAFSTFHDGWQDWGYGKELGEKLCDFGDMFYDRTISDYSNKLNKNLKIPPKFYSKIKSLYDVMNSFDDNLVINIEYKKKSEKKQKISKYINLEVLNYFVDMINKNPDDGLNSLYEKVLDKFNYKFVSDTLRNWLGENCCYCDEVKGKTPAQIRYIITKEIVEKWYSNYLIAKGY